MIAQSLFKFLQLLLKQRTSVADCWPYLFGVQIREAPSHSPWNDEHVSWHNCDNANTQTSLDREVAQQAKQQWSRSTTGMMRAGDVGLPTATMSQ